MNGSPPCPPDGYSLGIDLGTSGLRCCAIDAERNIVAESRQPGSPIHQPASGWAEQQADDWWQTLKRGLLDLPAEVRARIHHITVDGTSSTLLLTDTDGHPLTPALMYNDRRAATEAEQLKKIVPATSAAHGATSSLAKLLWLLQHGAPRNAGYALHQADWITGKFSGRWGISDWNNALKLGYDPAALRWPNWFDALPNAKALLPKVIAPGASIGAIAPDIAERFGLPEYTTIHSGTTDSTAAFIATGANRIGDAVTSIGSTLVMKVIAEKPIFAPEYGIYSHRLGNRWLVGGASNSGGAVLLQYFSVEEIEALSEKIDPEKPSGLDFYPLPRPGERFPINDPQLPPRIDPKEKHPPEKLLHGLLEGIANIERLGYQRLAELGAPWPKRVITAGGGAKNPVWIELRKRILGCDVTIAEFGEASYGVALLERQSSNY